MALNRLKPIVARAKRSVLLETLSGLARRMGPNTRLPTVKALRESLKVSSATLDRALDQLEARQLIVRKHGTGIFVSPRVEQKTIGLVFGGDIFEVGASPFWALLLKRLQEYAPTKKRRLKFYLDLQPGGGRGSGDQHEDLVEDLDLGRLHGLLLTAAQGPTQVERLAERGLPMVVFSQGFRKAWSVTIDYVGLIRLGVRRLVDRGCERIGLIASTELDLRRGTEDVFIGAIKSHGLRYHPQWRWEHPTLPLDPRESFETCEELGYRAIQGWLGGTRFDTLTGVTGDNRRVLLDQSLPDGIVIADDMLARGALVALTRLGLDPGRDIQIATHANTGSPSLASFGRELTLLEIDPDEIARVMWKMLEQLMAGESPEQEVAVIKPRVRKGSNR